MWKILCHALVYLRFCAVSILFSFYLPPGKVQQQGPWPVATRPTISHPEQKQEFATRAASVPKLNDEDSWHTEQEESLSRSRRPDQR